MNFAFSAGSMLFGGFTTAFVVFISVGYALSLAVLEIYNKNQYLFYFNNGLSKKQLFIYGYVLSMLFALLIAVVMALLKMLLQ